MLGPGGKKGRAASGSGKGASSITSREKKKGKEINRLEGKDATETRKKRGKEKSIVPPKGSPQKKRTGISQLLKKWERKKRKKRTSTRIKRKKVGAKRKRNIVHLCPSRSKSRPRIETPGRNALARKKQLILLQKRERKKKGEEGFFDQKIPARK